MTFHTPVLLKEAIEYLNVQPGEKYIDATIGGGGHTAAILGSGGFVLAIDSDPEAVEFVKGRFAAELEVEDSKLKVVQGNFKNIDSIAKEYGFENVSGMFFDLGMSSWQIEGSGRGFSFLRNELLDMRVDPSQTVGAKDLLAALTEKELDELFSKFAQEKRARAIARAVVGARRLRPIDSTQELAGLLAWVERGEREGFWGWYENVFSKEPDQFGGYGRRARVFQALRIIVNDELNSLKEALPRALQTLRVGGRLVVISFHSLEDRVVKEFGRNFSVQSDSGPLLRILTRKTIRPSAVEVNENPKSRSARLRAFKRV